MSSLLMTKRTSTAETSENLARGGGWGVEGTPSPDSQSLGTADWPQTATEAAMGCRGDIEEDGVLSPGPPWRWGPGQTWGGVTQSPGASGV